MTLNSEQWWVLPVFFIVAVLYSAAGFGGGSSYLAILSLAFPGQSAIRAVAYLCNISVTSLSTWRFQKANWLHWNDAWPFLLGSIPMAFIGGYMRLTDDAYFILLGLSLLLAGLLMVVKPSQKAPRIRMNSWGSRLTLSAFIGLLSGMVGIGGGIFLSPILHLIGWKDSKSIAALSALFILLNACFGAVAYFIQTGFELGGASLVLMAAVILGGLIGTSFSLTRKNQRHIKVITAFLVILVASRILWQRLV